MNEKKPTPLLQKVFELRKAKKISLAELGEAMGGVGKSGASHIENGDAPLKAEHIPAIAKLLEVEPWELFVDYESYQVGPITKEEAQLILAFRKVQDESRRKK